jgi:hypothetical protein
MGATLASSTMVSGGATHLLFGSLDCFDPPLGDCSLDKRPFVAASLSGKGHREKTPVI